MSLATAGSVRWPWITTIVALAVVNFLAWEVRTGRCTDYTAESGLASACTSGPAVGLAGAWGISGVSVLLVAYCVLRLARRRSSN
jgi:hypothetical protein